LDTEERHPAKPVKDSKKNVQNKNEIYIIVDIENLFSTAKQKCKTYSNLIIRNRL